MIDKNMYVRKYLHEKVQRAAAAYSTLYQSRRTQHCNEWMLASLYSPSNPNKYLTRRAGAGVTTAGPPIMIFSGFQNLFLFKFERGKY